jgi:hypothetical protein
MHQDTADQAKGVGQPSLGHRHSQRQRGLAGTQLSVLDVGVGHEFVAVGGIGFEGHHVKAATPRLVSYSFPEELNGEGAEVNAFPGNRLSRDDDCPVRPVNTELVEFRFQLPQFADPIRTGREGRRGLLESLSRLVDQFLSHLQLNQKVLTQSVYRQQQPLAASLVKQAFRVLPNGLSILESFEHMTRIRRGVRVAPGFVQSPGNAEQEFEREHGYALRKKKAPACPKRPGGGRHFRDTTHAA